MSDSLNLSEARQAYAEHATGYWSEIRNSDSEAANRHTEAGDVIVSAWTGAGRLTELLEPLLQDSSAQVRYASASDLLGTELSDRAIAVLEELQADPKGLVAPTARLRLMTWRREGVT